VTAARHDNPFLPTWTGRRGAAGSSRQPVRFGPRAGAEGSASGDGGGTAASASGSYLARSDLFSGRAASSTDIINRFQQRDGSGGTTGAVGAAGGNDDAKYLSLMDRLKQFLRQNGPVTSRTILAHFHDVPDTDAVVFRAMLKTVADLTDGKWILKD
jgi:hypothetical protein